MQIQKNLHEPTCLKCYDLVKQCYEWTKLSGGLKFTFVELVKNNRKHDGFLALLLKKKTLRRSALYKFVILNSERSAAIKDHAMIRFGIYYILL